MTVDSKAALRKRLEQLTPQQREALLRKLAQQGGSATVTDERSGTAARYPLSQAQRRLWLQAQLGPEASAAYNIAAAFQFDAALDAERMQTAWRRLLARHEVLRSAFVADGAELYQYPRASADWQLEQHTLDPQQDSAAQLLQLARSAAARPFDLQTDWLLRVVLCHGTAGMAGLVVVIHHSVCDGLSIAQMIDELATYYAADAAAEVPGASSPTARAAATAGLQYRDFVAYEAAADTQKALAYWRDIFATAPETLDALLDRPRPLRRDFSGSSLGVVVDAAAVAAFDALCRRNQATLFMGLVALAQLLLARWTGVGDVTLGTPVAGRPAARFERVVGPFVNTIALRQQLDLERSFAELLQQTRRRVLGGFEQQGLAFDALVSALGFVSEPGRSPLYDVMLGLDVASSRPLLFGTSRGHALRMPSHASKVDLTLHHERSDDGGLRLELEYATAVLDAATVQRLATAWQTLFTRIPQTPELPLGRLPLLTDAEQTQLLDVVNATQRSYPAASTLVAEFSKAVARWPQATAVHAGDLQLSYRELDQRSNALAQWLRQQSACAPGWRVALMLEKDARALIVLLGILKSGGVYVPLAANTPLPRVQQVLQAGAVQLLLAETSRLPELQDCAVQVVDTDALLATLQAASAAMTEAAETEAVEKQAAVTHAGAQDEAATPAYLMFTSGSTGKPKGTLIPQRAVLRLVCNTDYHQVQPGERVLLTGSLAFDAATFEIWGPLLNGGCVCIPEGTTLLEVQDFAALVQHYRVATAFLTTGLFNQLVDHSVTAFAQLQTVLTGGEKISVEHAGRLLSAQPSLRLLHVYGPTENTTFSSWHRITPQDLQHSTVPIGRPIANSRLYLLDACMQPVPVGVPGEIYCGGDGIALGYLEPSAAFMPDPFLPAGSGRLYRTGDRARWNAALELVFLGRQDRQVKIRGFRVELGEVEFHLRSLPGIIDACVQVRGEAGSAELVAWLVTDAAEYRSVAGLRAALQGRVPNYMLPARSVCLQRLPLNASGKVDVRALPEPDAAELPPAVDGELHGEQERTLARLYAQVLGWNDNAARSIDRSANFFALGGDSIRAIQLVTQARAAGLQFTLKDIFATDTLAGLAACATLLAQTEAVAVLPAAPLSPVQQWWLQRCGAVSHFNLSSVFRVAGSIDMVALRAALDALLQLHPALRLRLDTAAQQQRIAEQGTYLLLTQPPGLSRQQFWQSLQQGINLEAGVLLAVGVAVEADEPSATSEEPSATASESTLLAVVVHHLAADEVSGRLFADNLQRLYQRELGRRQGQSPDSLPQPVPEALAVTNWAQQLAERVQQGALDAALPWWTATVQRGTAILAQQQALFSAGDSARAATMESTTTLRSAVAHTLPLQLSSSLQRSAQQWLGMAPQEFLLAAFIAAWQRTLGVSGCVLSLEAHGREQLDGLGDCSATLGWFTALYPFAAGACDARGFNHYREIKDALRALPHKGFSYLPLRYYGTLDVQAALTLQPQLSFNYLGASDSGGTAWLQPTGERAAPDHAATITEPFRLDVLARMQDGCFALTLQGEAPRADVALNTLLLAWSEELQQLAQQLQTLVTGEHAAAHPRLPLLSRADCLHPFATLDALDATLAALQLPARDVVEILPLTGMQAGIWLQCRTQPSAYRDQVVLRLAGSIDAERFTAAVQALVAETQALRTGFAQTAQGELLQLVFRQRSASVEHLDCRTHGDAWRSVVEQRREARRSGPLDLLRDPLFSLLLVQLPDDAVELVIDFHHIVIDGWTSALLLTRLEALYCGTADKAAACKGMRSYFEWLGQQPASAARDYWQQLLGDYRSRSELPTQLPRVPAQPVQPLFHEARLGTALHAALQAWCGQQGLTLNSAIQTLWGLFLARQTGSDSVVYGATVAGRDSTLPEVERIAGMLINTLPLRIDVDGSDSFAALARATARQFAESLGHAHLSLAEIQTLSPARAALVTHTLVFENYPAADTTAARWAWQTQAIHDPMHFDFGLIVAPLQQDLSLRFVANGNLHPLSQLQAIGSELCALLTTLLQDTAPLPQVVFGTAARSWSLSANFTADSMVPLLQYHAWLRGSSTDVLLLPYDQSVQDLLDPASPLQRLPARQHVLLWRPPIGDGSVQEMEAREQLAVLLDALGRYARDRKDSRLYFVPCPWPDCDWSFYRELAAYAKGALASSSAAQVVSLDDLDAVYALERSCLPPAQVFGDIPYTEEFFAALANRLTRLRDLQERRPVKVFVVDADDTLWGGVVGEDGVQGLRLEPAHLLLQRQLLQARAAGALLCMVTKNNEDDVRAVFEQREMPLRWSHFTRVCAGWGPKSHSVLALADELSLGLDSFVFLDDSPLECEEVQQSCAGVVAIRLPPAAQREAFLRQLWLLDARAATREDTQRARMYAEELQRNTARRSSGSYADFLAALDIRVTLRRPGAADLPRLAQLSQRTNQFNTTGQRHDEAGIDALLQMPGRDLRCVEVRDKYGDYGLVGAVYVTQEAARWTLDGFMLSCRVLGRGVEHSIIRALAQDAAAAGAGELCIAFVRLPRNTPALRFLQSLPASVEGDVADGHCGFVLTPAAAAAVQPGQEAETVAADDGAGEVAGNVAGTAAQARHAAATTTAGTADAETTGAETTAAAPATTLGTGKLAIAQAACYRWLAEQLQSGSRILQQLQQHNVVQQTGPSAAQRAAQGGTAPQTPVEIVLARCFSELLGVADVRREDSFHALGGHSLKAMMLLSRIALQLGVTLDFNDLQQHPTLGALAGRVQELHDIQKLHDMQNLQGLHELQESHAMHEMHELQQHSLRSDTTPPLLPLPQAATYAASPGQQRLWMLEQIRAAGPSPFHMHATLRFAAALDRAALDRAVRELCQRHEALRTCFAETEPGTLLQRVLPLAELDTAVRWQGKVLPLAAVPDWAQQQATAAFDLQQAPLLRLAAADIDDGGVALCITLHHIIGDGWSVGIVSRELSQLYALHSGATTQPLPPVGPLQFRDFAVWQRQWLHSAAGQRCIEFWRTHFAEPVEALQLPASAARPVLQQSSGASVELQVAAADWQALQHLLAQAGCSAFSGLFAALQLVLARLSGQRNFCVGTAVAGRQHPQLESVVGFFVNLLPLRSTLTLDATVADFLQTVAREVNTCLSQQALPFDSIVSALELERDPGRSPLFDVLLVLQNAELPPLQFGTQLAQVLPAASVTSQYDLTLNAFPHEDGGLQLIAEYNSSIYAAADMQLLLRCLQRTLQALVQQADARAGDLQWLPDVDLAAVMACEGRPLPPCQDLLPDLLRQVLPQAQGHISDERQHWTYAQLHAEMTRVARLLRTTLHAAGDRRRPTARQWHVGVIGQRSVRSIAALLAVMDAGAVYVPLDLANPLERLAAMIAEGSIDVLLATDAEGAALAVQLQEKSQGHRQTQLGAKPGMQEIPEVAAPTSIMRPPLLLHYDAVTPAASSADPSAAHSAAEATAAPSLHPDAVAYMIFTSGSTGKPKGVPITHSGFATMIREQIVAFDVQPTDVCGQFAALSFDASLSEIFLALASGASLALAPDAVRGDVDAFLHWLDAGGVTVLTLPPVFLHALQRRQLAQLRVLITAGEAAIAEDLRYYAQQLRVINAYGPTETSVCASVYPVPAEADWPFGVPIGAALPGVVLSVRDAAGARVPVGVAGELYIGGPTLSPGYFAADALTKEKFIQRDDASGVQRWYRSGDLVRWRHDGQLDYLGRSDTQIKVRGYRVEPGEIEQVARGVAGVQDAVALLHPQSGLLLYCVAQVADAAAADALRERVLAVLATQLPRYMVPGDVLLLDVFPLSASGKIARNALLAMATTRPRAFEAPASAAERLLATAWQQALQVEPVGRNDDFFALGGDSIKALQVVAALRRQGQMCALKDFFLHPRLADMARVLAALATLPGQTTAASESAPLAGRLPLLPVQQWFLRSRSPAVAGHFHIVVALRTDAAMSSDHLHELFAALLQRHDALRARFTQVDGEWQQELVAAPDTTQLLVPFQRRVNADARGEAEDDAAIEALACRPFDLATAPLFRVVQVLAADGSSEGIVLALHHLIADWVSLRILLADLNALGLALLTPAEVSPPAVAPRQLQAVTALRCAEAEACRSAVPPAFRKAGALLQHVAGAPHAEPQHAQPQHAEHHHAELQTLHLKFDDGRLAALQAYLQRASEVCGQRLRLQDLLLATLVREVAALFDVDCLPVLVEGHGRDEALDLSQQVAWLTRARLLLLDAGDHAPDGSQHHASTAALMHAHAALQQASAQPDVFACLAGADEVPAMLPALLGFNYLGEFTQEPDAAQPFILQERVFHSAVSAQSPVDLPLQVEFHVMNGALELQLAWSPRMLDSNRLRASMARIRETLERLQ